MISLVGDQIAWIVWCRRKADVGQIARRRLKRGIARRRVAFVGRMDRRRNNDAGVEVDRVLGLVAQTRRAVLHLGDLRVGIGRARPVLVRKLLALTFSVKPDEVVDRRRRHAALLGHARQHFPRYVSPQSRRTMVRSAALASMVESARPSPVRARRPVPEPSRRLSHGPRAARDFASSTARNDREPCHGSPSAETHEATGNPNCATRCPARCR
jgi:hypothetical protein